jgi:hypothetical protein
MATAKLGVHDSRVKTTSPPGTNDYRIAGAHEGNAAR